MEIQTVWRQVLDSLFPIHCLGECGAEGKWVCGNCRALLIARPQFLCAGCGRASAGGMTHKKCAEATALDQLVAAYSYAHPIIKNGIKEYKFHGAYELEDLLTGLAVSTTEKMRTLFPAGAAVVPVPLHPSRERERGFNQAEKIGRAVSVALGAQLVTPLARARRTDHQSQLPTNERAQNCSSAFRSLPVSGDFILIDDVVTTGATMNEAARALKLAGAHSVTGFALAYG